MKVNTSLKANGEIGEPLNFLGNISYFEVSLCHSRERVGEIVNIIRCPLAIR